MKKTSKKHLKWLLSKNPEILKIRVEIAYKLLLDEINKNIS